MSFWCRAPPEVLPGQCRYPHPADQDGRAGHPPYFRRHGHRHRGQPGHRHGPGRRHGGDPQSNLGDEEQAEHVRRVKRYESGMVVNPVTIGPDATLAEALSLMERHHISGVPVVENVDAKGAGKLVGILTNRDVRFAADPRQKISELMTKERLVTVREGVQARRGQAPAAPVPDREAAGGGRGLSLRRADHRQGYREGPEIPQCQQGREGPPARGGGDRGG